MSGNDPTSDFPSGLSNLARQARAAAGYERLEQFTRVSEASILKLHDMGPKGLELIRRALIDQGLSFAGGAQGTE